MKNIVCLIGLLLLIGCKQEPEIHREYFMEECPEKTKPNVSKLKKELTEKGFSTFTYFDDKTKDSVLMQQYFMVFLKKGDNRSQSKTEADSLQTLHIAHLTTMYEKGFADISGPMGDDGDLRGITIYNVATIQIADSLANLDPMVKAGRLKVEVRPWWAAKGFSLR